MFLFRLHYFVTLQRLEFKVVEVPTYLVDQALVHGQEFYENIVRVIQPLQGDLFEHTV
jgi:hypothetical protein